MVSHFVAPKDREANFRSCGIVCKTSTIILIIIGKIMTASTIPPEKTEYPVTDRPNRGATHPPTIGTTNKTPHTPYSTGGIAANTFIKGSTKLRRRAEAYSTRYTDASIQSGTAMHSEISVTQTVPMINGKKPKSPLSGDHTLWLRISQML